ncbi:MAG: lysylphosphatidylglycerol synthase domain-containing protein [Litoreibacter sp.]|nr:lysylphosphatidylglycerol synthase domain-containing protein [Litoreibacter sp.]
MNSDTDRNTSKSQPLWRRVLLVIAALGFILGIVLSYRAQPEVFSNLNPGILLLLASVAVPLTVLLNALEFQKSAALLGQKLALGPAAEVTIIGSVANMLPIPGGTMVRIAALKAGGASLKKGTSVTLLVSLLWISIAFIYAAFWLWGMGQRSSGGISAVFAVIGVGALVACIWLFFRTAPKAQIIGQLVLIKIGLVLIDATRIYLCFLALGVAGSFAQASVLTASSVLGAAVSIVPAGLGIREGAAALLAPFIALAAASAFLATSLNRIVGLAVMAPVALFLGMRRDKAYQLVNQ